MEDVLSEIFKQVLNIPTYKTLLITSKCFRALSTIDNICNPLITLLNMFPDEAWNYKELTVNRNVNMDYILNHSDKPWDSLYLSITQNKTRNYFDKQFAQPIIEDTALDKTTFSYWHNTDQYWYNMSKYVTMEQLYKFPDKPWNWKGISNNTCLTMNVILDHLDKSWDWTKISRYSNIPMDIVQLHSDKPWCYKSMSVNQNLTINFILNNQDKPWDYAHMSENNFGF